MLKALRCRVLWRIRLFSRGRGRHNSFVVRVLCFLIDGCYTHQGSFISHFWIRSRTRQGREAICFLQDWVLVLLTGVISRAGEYRCR